MKHRTPEEEAAQKLAGEKSDGAMQPADVVPEPKQKTFAVYSRVEIRATDEMEAMTMVRSEADPHHAQIAENLTQNAMAREIDPQDDRVIRIALSGDQKNELIIQGRITLIGVLVEGLSKQVEISLVAPDEIEARDSAAEGS